MKIVSIKTIPLGGAVVLLKASAGEVASYVSDGEGTFRFENLAPGSYTIVAALDGFDALNASVEQVHDAVSVGGNPTVMGH